MIGRILRGAVSAVAFSAPSLAQACTVCMGDVNSKTAGAINAAMFLMIGAIGSMLTALGAFAFYLSRRAATAAPPYVEMAHATGDVDDFSQQ